MNVLLACEESQTVCIEMRKMGHNAFSCDLLGCSGGHPEWHIQGDVRNVLNPSTVFEGELPGIEFFTMDNELHSFVGKWDMIIAFPPCTYMSKAGARWMFPKGELSQERYAKAMEAKEFFMQIFNADCDRIAIENPRPLKVVELPEPQQVIQPYQFGHPYSKATCLWLKNLPLLEPTEIVKEYKPYCPSNTGGVSRGQSYNSGGAVRGDDAVNRAKTFVGVGRAMASQWGDENEC